MATLNEKLYAISGGGSPAIDYFDANNPAAGWKRYSQAAFPVPKGGISCTAIRTGMNFLLASASAHDLLSTDVSVPFTMPSFGFGQTLPKKAILAAMTCVFVDM